MEPKGNANSEDANGALTGDQGGQEKEEQGDCERETDQAGAVGEGGQASSHGPSLSTIPEVATDVMS